MNCKVCGSAEFVTNDGITYCTECQSQIEETQTEGTLDPTLTRDIGSSGPKKAPTEKKQEYSDWISVEGFNHILFMQVSSLIKLGASPQLKSTVLSIWSKYLQKCEVVFRTDYQATDSRPLLGPLPMKRDVQILYGDKQILKRKRKKPEESDPEVSENPSADECPSVDGSDVESESNISLSTESVPAKPKYSSHAKKMLRKKKKPTHSSNRKVFSMTLSKTLSIIYLGLLYNEDQLSLLDLIRFVYQEKVPYVNLLDKLPVKLQMCSDQCTFLTYAVPDMCFILKTAREIMQFIKLPEYKEPSVILFAARFIKDLNLPEDMLSIVEKILKAYKEELCHYSTAPKIETIPVEFQVLASTLIAMKMLFVLDEKFEIEHSKVMNKLNAIYPDRKYFEWCEWEKQSKVKEFLFLCDKPGYSVTNNLDSLSANLIISKYPFTRLSKSSTEAKNRKDLGPIKCRINEILSNVVHIPSSNPNVPSSFPLKRAVKCFIEEWRTLPMFKETKEIDFNLLKKDFSSCSLSFSPLQFDEVEDELPYLLMTSLYLPHTIVNLGFKSIYKSAATYHHQVICTTSSYWYLHWTVNESGMSELSSNWLEKLPVSFKWLLNFFSKYAYCTNIALYKEVAKMERIIHFQKIRVTHNARIKNKISVKL